MYLYNLDPLKPHFYLVKMEFTGVYIIFLISAKNIKTVLTSTHNLCFEQEYENIRFFFIWNGPFFGCKIFNIFE